MTKPNRQLVLLGGLVAVGVLAYVVPPMLNGPAGTVATPSNQAAGTNAAAPEAPVVDLDLERLTRERDPLPESNRDPFRFRTTAPPPSPRTAETRAAPRPADLLPPVPAGPPVPPPPPPIPVKFFGLVELRGGIKVAAFSDTRGNTFYGKEGDIIEGRYRLLRISADSVELAYLDGRGRQTIRLTGQ
jgi:hypothetical protein